MLTLGDFVAGVKRATVNWADGDFGAKATLAHPSLPRADTSTAPTGPHGNHTVASP
jgi:hypothetical protein